MQQAVHILVLNHNGRWLVERYLPSVLACAGAARVACRVTVVDNASQDDSVAFIRRRWPEVGVMEMTNRGLVSFNDAVRRVDEPVVLLLNNDVALAPGCVEQLARAFDDPDCFLAGPLCWTSSGRYEGTRSELCFRRGLVHTRLTPGSTDRARRTPGYTASAGAVLAVSRDKFLALGGFDPLFLPGRFEDLDFAFRGWRAGWKACYAPDAQAYHEGSATFGPHFHGSRGAQLDARNALLFAWKHLRDPRYLAAHLLFLGLRLVRAIVAGQADYLRGCADALRRLRQALESGRRSVPPVRSERELFALLGRDRLIGGSTGTPGGAAGASSSAEMEISTPEL